MDFPIMMRFDLDSPVSVTTGSTYVIELQQSPQSVRWYLVNPSGGYAAGTAVTDGTADPSGDYLFVTYGAGDALTVNIRSSSIGGAILGTATATVPVASPTLVHVDFPTPIPTTPGDQYVIELQQGVQSIRWYHVNPGGAYPSGTGITDGIIEPVGDYIFNTYAAAGPTATSLSINLTPPTVDIGTSPPGTGTISASINPVVSGLPISISYSTNALGPWTLITNGLTDGSGMYSVIWAPPATGTYYFRADFAGDSSYAASTTTSDPNSMVVVPEFPLVPTSVILALAVGMFQALRGRTRKQRK
jgi:hypothetical protein